MIYFYTKQENATYRWILFRYIEMGAARAPEVMIRSLLASVPILMLIFSTIFTFLDFKSPFKAIAQIDPMTTTKHLLSSSIQNQTGLVETSNLMDSNMSTILKLLSSVIETRLNKSTAILEITSNLPEVTNISYANAITEKFMGIPQDLDLQKRNVATDVLTLNKDIATIFFLTPKGDIYMGEPYSNQIQLPRLNYADRDWYKGVTRTNDTYTSTVFLSAAIRVPSIAIAVPVYENSVESGSVNINQTSSPVVGYWVGILNLTKIKEDLSGLNLLSHDNEVILVDHNGTQVVNVLARTMNVCSPLSLANQTLKSYSQLQSVKNALDGKSGVTVEMLNNTRKTVYHYPVQSQPHEWALLLLRPSH
jgi:Cache domain